MPAVVLLLIPISLAIASAATWALVRTGHRLETFDTEPIAGQRKMPRRRVPNTGGIAITAGVLLPMAAAIAGVHLTPDSLVRMLPVIEPHLPGLRAETGAALWLLACALAMHAMGVVDDRRPLGVWPKLLVMLGASATVVLATDSRLLELLDARVGGAWLSALITILWIAMVTNALNFMDNMDGLAGGSALVASLCFLAATLISGQWFVAGTLALLAGGLAGFLIFNFPPARIFMGDGGSLVVGFLLGFLTVRTTYYDPTADPGATSAADPGWLSGAWYGVLMPLAVLAVPLYDLLSVTLIRLSQRRSPFVGDLQHFSHRLVRRGLTHRQTALLVAGLTGVTGISGVVLGSVAPWQALLMGAQIGLILAMLALFEWGSSPGAGAGAEAASPLEHRGPGDGQ